jgi:hypothetical protein
MFKNPWLGFRTLNEGEKPDNLFWFGLGCWKGYDKYADYMNYIPLLRCSTKEDFTDFDKLSDL